MFEKSIATINKIQGLIKTWVLPFTCVLCSRSADREQDLCSACLKDLPIITQSCARCANKILFEPSLNEKLYCGSCLKNPPPFSATHALFTYEEPIISLILDLKFKQQLSSARILGELMADKIRGEWYTKKPLPDCLLPLPWHRERLKERGFNQALELARPISKALQLTIETQAVERIENTAPQTQLPAEKRKINLKNAFRVDASLRGQTIAILDDVMTTGSTVTALTEALLKAGVKQIEIWCCARARLPSSTP
jgi:ComF family protein